MMNGFKMLSDNYKNFLKDETDKRIITEMEKKVKVLDFLSTCDKKEICYLFDSSAFNDIFLAYTDKVMFDLLKEGELTDTQVSKLQNSFTRILNGISAEGVLDDME